MQKNAPLLRSSRAVLKEESCVTASAKSAASVNQWQPVRLSVASATVALLEILSGYGDGAAGSLAGHCNKVRYQWYGGSTTGGTMQPRMR